MKIEKINKETLVDLKIETIGEAYNLILILTFFINMAKSHAAINYGCAANFAIDIIKQLKEYS